MLPQLAEQVVLDDAGVDHILQHAIGTFKDMYQSRDLLCDVRDASTTYPGSPSGRLSLQASTPFR